MCDCVGGGKKEKKGSGEGIRDVKGKNRVSGLNGKIENFSRPSCADFI